MEKEMLIKLINENMSQYQIAEKLSCSQRNVRYWLIKYGLKTNHLSFKSIGVKDYGTHKHCIKCDTTKELNFFYDKRGKVGSSAYCKECMKRQSHERHAEFKKLAIEYKGGKCVNCNYSKCVSALEFHHLNPTEKDFNLGSIKAYVFNDKIKRELDKCILVCSNCHREIHEELNPRYIPSLS